MSASQTASDVTHVQQGGEQGAAVDDSAPTIDEVDDYYLDPEVLVQDENYEETEAAEEEGAAPVVVAVAGRAGKCVDVKGRRFTLVLFSDLPSAEAAKKTVLLTNGAKSRLHANTQETLPMTLAKARHEMKLAPGVTPSLEKKIA